MQINFRKKVFSVLTIIGIFFISVQSSKASPNQYFPFSEQREKASQNKSSQKIPKSIKKLSFEEILEKIKNSVDKNNKLKKISTKIIKGDIILPQHKIKGKLISKYKLPHYSLKIIKFPKNTNKISYNGEKAYRIINGNKEIIKEGINYNFIKFNTAFESFRYEWNNLFSDIKIDKKLHKINNYDCIRLKCRPAKRYNIKEPVFLYIDTNNFLLRRIIMKVIVGKTKVSEIINIKKYKNINGIKLPSVTITNILGTKIKFKLNKAVFNKKIQTENFSL